MTRRGYQGRRTEKQREESRGIEAPGSADADVQPDGKWRAARVPFQPSRHAIHILTDPPELLSFRASAASVYGYAPVLPRSRTHFARLHASLGHTLRRPPPITARPPLRRRARAGRRCCPARDP